MKHVSSCSYLKERNLAQQAQDTLCNTRTRHTGTWKTSHSKHRTLSATQGQDMHAERHQQQLPGRKNPHTASAGHSLQHRDKTCMKHVSSCSYLKERNLAQQAQDTLCNTRTRHTGTWKTSRSKHRTLSATQGQDMHAERHQQQLPGRKNPRTASTGHSLQYKDKADRK